MTETIARFISSHKWQRKWQLLVIQQSAIATIRPSAMADEQDSAEFH
jgi:hypothetical protein